jgi:integrase/recombinase XerD
MLVRYFRRPSRIEQLRSITGGHLLEGFAKELSQGRYQWVAARKHLRAVEHFLHWIALRNLSITSVEERYAQQFLDHLKRCRCRGHHPPLKPHRQKYSVELWFDYLRRVGIVPTPTFLSPYFTSAFKELDPIPQFKATAKLGEFLQSRFLPSF